VELTTLLPSSALRVRRCACSFCRKHGARTTTDPNGHLRIHVRGETLRYQFATEGAEYLICARCGVYVAAVMDGVRATINVNVLEGEFEEGEPVDYGSESAEERRERRRKAWTPTEVL
jgi:hypothetical protein